jgi:hypothetical protein
MRTMKVVSGGGADRTLLAITAVGIYCLMTVSTVGIATICSVTPAEAARGGHGGGHGSYHGGHGGYRGGYHYGGHRGYYGGYGGYYDGYYYVYGYPDDCHWSPRYGRWVCPYGY